jgi:capping protein alpha
LNDDRVLKKSLSRIHAKYNQDQFIQCELDGLSTEPCLITEYNELPDGRYYDPRTKQSFKYDHMHGKPSEFELYADVDQLSEAWRVPIEKELTHYVKVHYKDAACSVFGSSDQGHVTIVVCIEAHKYQPGNFWNARWRSRWAVTFQPHNSGGSECEMKGVIKAQVHYYEEGNVQLVSQKDVDDVVRIGDGEFMAKELTKAVEKAENEYQVSGLFVLGLIAARV